MSKSIFCIGSSVRLAYQDFLPDNLPKLWTIKGPEEKCGDSGNIYKNLDTWLYKRSPDFILLSSGLHDIRYSIRRGENQVSLAQYSTNLKRIFTKLKERENTQTVWLTISPIDENTYNNKKLTTGTVRVYKRFQKDFDLYNDEALKLAKEMNVPVIDLNEPVFKKNIMPHLLEDGVHYTSVGYMMIAEKIAQYLLEQTEKA